ncbi:uncharacterized protein LOC134528896 [Bacillus rossius redtenbacheri]|uniref:uncharacterized protein LOC134528896 n=1 Tax=Bacillus rossius redtenbacheri TaxID=93214 RepID=UPI002FDD07E8
MALDVGTRYAGLRNSGRQQPAADTEYGEAPSHKPQQSDEGVSYDDHSPSSKGQGQPWAHGGAGSTQPESTRSLSKTQKRRDSIEPPHDEESARQVHGRTMGRSTMGSHRQAWQPRRQSNAGMAGKCQEVGQTDGQGEGLQYPRRRRGSVHATRCQIYVKANAAHRQCTGVAAIVTMLAPEVHTSTTPGGQTTTKAEWSHCADADTFLAMSLPETRILPMPLQPTPPPQTPPPTLPPPADQWVAGAAPGSSDIKTTHCKAADATTVHDIIITPPPTPPPPMPPPPTPPPHAENATAGQQAAEAVTHHAMINTPPPTPPPPTAVKAPGGLTRCKPAVLPHPPEDKTTTEATMTTECGTLRGIRHLPSHSQSARRHITHVTTGVPLTQATHITKDVPLTSDTHVTKGMPLTPATHVTKGVPLMHVREGVPLTTATHITKGVPLTHIREGMPLTPVTHVTQGVPLPPAAHVTGGVPLPLAAHCTEGVPLPPAMHVTGGVPLLPTTHDTGGVPLPPAAQVTGGMTLPPASHDTGGVPLPPAMHVTGGVPLLPTTHDTGGVPLPPATHDTGGMPPLPAAHCTEGVTLSPALHVTGGMPLLPPCPPLRVHHCHPPHMPLKAPRHRPPLRVRHCCPPHAPLKVPRHRPPQRACHLGSAAACR